MRPLHRNVGPALIVALACSIAACTSDPVAAAKAHVSRGDRALAAGQPKDAAIEYRAAIQSDPRNGDARFKLGQVALSLGDVATAQEQFVRAADLMPSSLEAELKAGQILLVAKKYDDAKSRADKAIALNPNSADALILRGNALAGLKDFNAAVEEVQQAIRIDPQGTVAYTELGALQWVRGNGAEAEAAFLKAIAVSPKSVVARLALANYYWATDKREAAEAALKDALAIEPKNVAVNRSLGYVYLALNRRAEAETPLKVVAEGTTDTTAKLILAEYYESAGRPSDAIRVLDDLAKDPTMRSVAASRKAGVLYASGRKAEAYAVLDDALKTNAKDDSALLQRANLLFADGRTDDALKAAEAAQSVAPSSAGPPYAIARIHAARENWEDAIASFLAALQKSPNLVPAQIGLATAYLAAGRPDDALHASETTLAAEPRNTAALIIKLRALLAAGNVVGVDQTLKQLPASATASAVVQSEIGLLALLKHDAPGARTAFQAALRVDPANVDALQGITRLDFAEKKSADARARIDALVAKQTPSSPVLVLAAQIHTSLGDRPAAEKLLQRAIDADPQNFQAYMLLGQTYAAEQRLDDAIAQIDRVSSRKASAVAAHTMIGMLLEMQHKPEDARKRYEQVLNVDPKAAVASNNLAMIYLNSGGNLDVALKLAQTAKAQLPNTPEVSDTLGLVYYRKGLAPLAIGAFQESLAKDPKNAGYVAHLGMAYAKAGDSARARASLKQAFALSQNFPDAGEARAVLAQVKGGF